MTGLTHDQGIVGIASALWLDLAWKSSLVLAAVLVLHFALGRRRVLVRSAVCHAGVLALLALPVLGVLLPPVRIETPAVTVVVNEEPAVPAAVALPAIGDAPGYRSDGSHRTYTTQIDREIAARDDVPEAKTASSTQTEATTAAPTIDWPATLAAGLLGAYALVALLRLAAVFVAQRSARTLIASGRAVDLDILPPTLARLTQMLGIKRPVRVLRSARVRVPVVLGALRPVVLLPDSLVRSNPDAECLESILLHELAHVKRSDYAWNLALRVVLAVYWPQPLAWLLARQVSLLREQACDDLCVGIKGGAAGYRDTLLTVARELTRPTPAPALGMAMARRGTLRRRLERLDQTKGAKTCLPGPAKRAVLLAAMIALAACVGPLRFTRATPKDEPQDAKAPAGAPDRIEIAVMAKDTGKPLASAKFAALVDMQHREFKADEQGRLTIDLSKRTFKDALSFDVWADGYVQQRHSFSQVDKRQPKIPSEYKVELLPGEETLGGKVVDEDGKPITGVKVEIWGYLGEKKQKDELAYHVDTVTDKDGQWRARNFRSMTFAYLYLSHPDYLSDGGRRPRAHGRPIASEPPTPDEKPVDILRDFSDVQVMKRGVPVAGKVVDAQGKPVAGAEVGWFDAKDRMGVFHDDLELTTTGADGTFRFANALPGDLMLQVKAKGHAPQLKFIDATKGIEDVAIAVEPARTLTGRVVDMKGKPIPEAFVVVDTWRGARSLGVFLSTDADGRFRWTEAPADTVQLNATKTGYEYATQKRASADGDVTITIKRILSISGRVRDAETGKGIDYLDVEVGTPDETGKTVWKQDNQVFAHQGRLQASLDAEKASTFQMRYKAPGYATFESRVFQADEGQVEYDVKLTKTDAPQGEKLSGVVKRPDGKPLEGAEVVVTYSAIASGDRDTVPSLSVSVEDGRIVQIGQQRLTVVKTDAQGRFTIGREPDPRGQRYTLIVVHPEFYSEVKRAEFEANSAITARPWARIEGIAKIGSRPARNIAVRYYAERGGADDMPHINAIGTVTTDAEGRFTINNVVPGDARVARDYRDGNDVRAWTNGVLVRTKAGETTHVELGGKGRPVVARIAVPEGVDPRSRFAEYSEYEIESDRPIIPYPKELLAKRDERLIEWVKQWQASEEGFAYRRDWFRFGQAKPERDGTIRVDDVPPGEYKLKLTFAAEPRYALSPDRVFYATKQFTIPEGRSDEPFDLGTLTPKAKLFLKVGQPAPAFDIKTIDGKPLRLADLKGKYVLLDFWATWCGPCIAEFPTLKEATDLYGKDGRIAFVSLSLDAEVQTVKDFLAKRADHPETIQGFLGAWSEDSVAAAYGVESIPSIFLVGPDGNIVARDLRGEDVPARLRGILGEPK